MSGYLPIDMVFSVHDEDGNERGDLEVQTDKHGNPISVFLGGVRVRGQVDVLEFVALLLSQGYLMARADREFNARHEKDPFTEHKRQVEYDMERKAEGS